MPGAQDIRVVYPIQDFDPKIGLAPITNNFAAGIDNFLSKGHAVNRITIIMMDGSPEGRHLGDFSITKSEFTALKSRSPDFFREMHSYVELDQGFSVELGLMQLAQSAKDVTIVREDIDQGVAISVSFKLERQKQNAWQKTPLDSIDMFEQLMANTVRTAFESDSKITRVLVRADIDEEDSRTDSTMIANYEMERDEFEAIIGRWDDLRYRIYDDINYTPIFLMDYATESTVLSMDFGRKTVVRLSYEPAYQSIGKTIGQLERDASEMIRYLFGKYSNVEEAELRFIAKVPAEKGKPTIDGVHEIVQDFLVVNAHKGVFTAMKTEGLTPQQVLYNFNTVWSAKALELSIRESLFQAKDYFRSIEFSAAHDEAIVVIDSCLLTNDMFYRPRVDAVQKQLAQGYKANLEDEVYRILEESAKKLIFDIHPPFLQSATFSLEAVFRDTTGHETEVRDLGGVTFGKEDIANYWFQTEDPSELEWVEEESDSLDIDNDEVLCQK